jgi:hypothetical protein
MWTNPNDIALWYRDKIRVVAHCETESRGCYSRREDIVGIIEVEPDYENQVISIDGISYFAFAVALHNAEDQQIADAVGELFHTEFQSEINREIVLDLLRAGRFKR